MRSIASLARLDGRVALVTGGAGHLGGAIADTLAELGATVCVLDVVAAGAAATAARLRTTYGTPSEALVVDLADDASVADVPRQIRESCGRLDILVNNAALVGTTALRGWAVPFADQRVDTWRQALDINLTAPFLLTQACHPMLQESGAGSIINIGSIYGMSAPVMSLYGGTGLGNPAAYAASKGGLLQLTRWLATVLAPAVRCNAVALGGIERGQTSEFVGRYVERTPLARMGREEDLKGAIAYLAGDLAGYVTGHTLVVDGGWTTW